jgi:predicted double-glycine peptidase
VKQAWNGATLQALFDATAQPGVVTTGYRMRRLSDTLAADTPWIVLLGSAKRRHYVTLLAVRADSVVVYDPW